MRGASPAHSRRQLERANAELGEFLQTEVGDEVAKPVDLRTVPDQWRLPFATFRNWWQVILNELAELCWRNAPGKVRRDSAKTSAHGMYG
jgi:hypothetical protein